MKHLTEEELSCLFDTPMFHAIGEAADQLGLQCYAVGGYVRDLFLERPSKDIDCVVVDPQEIENCKSSDRKCDGPGIRVAEALGKRLGKGAHVSIFRNFGTAQVKWKGQEVEFVGARRESYSRDSRKPIVEDGTLEEDLDRRDFTINALAYCLTSEGLVDGKRLVDRFGGLLDMEDGLIATPLDPDITFSDDPLRMMRCIRFATQLRFQIEDETQEALSRNAERIKIISQERIIDELNKIMLSQVPSIGFVELSRCGLLPLIFPELAALEGVEVRNGRAHKDNFYHTLEVLDNVAKATPIAFPSVADGDSLSLLGQQSHSEATLKTPVAQGDGDDGQFSSTLERSGEGSLWLRWAALLHDIGKPRSKRWEEKVGWTFHNHNYIGQKMVAPIFRRMKLPLDERLAYVEKLVGLHMRPIAIADEEVTDSAVRRMLFEAGEDIDDLMVLCEADITSKNQQKKERFLENFQLVREKIADLKARDNYRTWQNPITGEEIMETFGLKPCREIGMIKQAVKDAIWDSLIPNNHDSARQYMLEKAAEMGLQPVTNS